MKFQLTTIPYSFKRIAFCFLFISMMGWLGAQCPTGSVLLETQADVDALSGCTHITGSLIIKSDPPSSISNLNALSSIDQIDGALTVLNNSALTDASGLSGINSIGTHIQIVGNVILGSLDLHNVASVNMQQIEISGNSSLTNLALPEHVPSVEGHVVIVANPLLANWSGLDILTHIGGVLRISGTLEASFPDFSGLTFVGLSIEIRNNPNVTSLDFHNVASVNMQQIEITGNSSLLNLALPEHVPSVAGNVVISQNPLLASWTGLDILTHIGGVLRIDGTGEASFPDFSGLGFVGLSIEIRNNPNVTNLDFHNVASVNIQQIEITGNSSLSDLALPEHVPSVAGHVLIVGNPLLASWTGLDILTHIGGVLRIDGTGEASFPDFSGLTFIGLSIEIRNNPNVTNLDFHNVASVNMQQIEIWGNSSLTNLALPEHVPSVAGHVLIHSNPLLASMIGLDALTTVGGILRIHSTQAPEFPGLSSLNSIGVEFSLSGNTEITNLNWLTNLNHIGNSLYITYNPKLSYCAVDGICNYLSGAGSRAVYGNTGCCLNEPVLSNACSNPGSGGQEICDGIDNDCDGLIDEDFDQDGDGYISCVDDCDDNNSATNPGAVEICDGIDNNCNGEIDEGFDQDGDGIADCSDNCPNTSNLGQEDSDCDGVGDACDQWPGCDDDEDSDGDGTPDCVDLDEMANWPCGNNGNKVTICHVPPGNPANRKTQCVGSSAVPSHLDHGDYIGECDQVYCSGNNQISTPNNHSLSAVGFQLYPNPARDILTLDLYNYLNQNISISIFNHLGQQVLYLPGQELHTPSLSIDLVNRELPDGIYLLSVRTAEGQETKQFMISR